MNHLPVRLNAALPPPPSPGGPSAGWQASAGSWWLQTFLSEPIPQRYSRRPGVRFDGDAGAAQIIPTYPSLAVSVDASTSSARQMIRWPMAPSRRPPAPLP